MTRPVLLLHVGAMKTGTTYLQDLMLANREQLDAVGRHVVGPSWSRQVRATQDLLGLDQHDPQIASLSEGAWPGLVREVQARDDGWSVVSMEFLSFARRRHVERAVRDLAGVDVHVVVTVRDATSTVPAQWQTSVTSGSTHDWPTFQQGVRRSAGALWPARAVAGDAAVREFRRTQDVGRMLRTWGRLVPPERLHVVLVPATRRDPDELWHRFAQVLDVDPAVATQAARKSNPSLGHASTELVRRVNVALGDGALPWDYNRTVKAPLGGRILGARRDVEQRPRLDPETAAFARAWNARTREAVRRSGARVVGDPHADLPTDDAPAQGGAGEGAVGATGPADAEVLEAARTAWAGLASLVERRRRKVNRLLGARPPQPHEDRDPRWVAASGGDRLELDQAVTDLTRLARGAMQLRREIRELQETEEESEAD